MYILKFIFRPFCVIKAAKFVFYLELSKKAVHKTKEINNSFVHGIN